MKIAIVDDDFLSPKYWHERAAFQRSGGGQLLAMTKWPLKTTFFSFSFSFFFLSSPSSTFLIEGVLGSKNLFSES